MSKADQRNEGDRLMPLSTAKACCAVAGGVLSIAALLPADARAQNCDRATTAQLSFGTELVPPYVLINAFTFFDPDGPGASGPRLIIGGDWFTGSIAILGNTLSPASPFASFFPIGDGLDGPVYALTTYDPDGPAGPSPELLIAGGSFSYSLGSEVSNIAAWDGSQWQPLGSGTNGPVTGLAVVDYDDAGPQPPMLIASGGFSTAGGTSQPWIAAWNGSAWVDVPGYGLGNGRSVTAIAAVRIAPSFGAPTVPALAIAQYDESLYNATVGVYGSAGPVGGPFNQVNGYFNALYPWTPSALPSTLFVGGASNSASLGQIDLSGTSFGLPPLPVNGPIYAFTSSDLDGPGPLPPELFVGGDFLRAANLNSPYLTRFNGTLFRPALFVQDPVLALTEYDPDGNGPSLPIVLASTVGGSTTTALTLYGNLDAPRLISNQPAAIQTDPGTLVDLYVDLSAGTNSLTLQWYHNGQPLIEGLGESGVFVTGSNTSLLRLDGVQEADSGTYTLAASNTCGSSSLVVTQLIVGIPANTCDADYNRDSVRNLDDISDFITDFYVTVPIPGGLQPSAPTYADIVVGFGEPCPEAPDAPAPYASDAYRANGYRVGFSLDGNNDCPASSGQNFPSLDNLGDFISGFYASTCG
jgi:hypothetical protein